MTDIVLRVYSVIFMMILLKKILNHADSPKSAYRLLLVTVALHLPWLGRIWSVW